MRTPRGVEWVLERGSKGAFVLVFSLVGYLLPPRGSAGTCQFGSCYRRFDGQINNSPNRLPRLASRFWTSHVIALIFSVSLPAEDVEFLTPSAERTDFHSRSSVLHLAIYMLQGAQLTSSYEAASAQWEDMPDGVNWAGAGTHPPSGPPRTEPPPPPSPALMRRGEIRMVELEVGPRPGNGNGTQGQKIRRPAVIVSNDGANETARRLGHGVVTVVPVTLSVRRSFPFKRSCGRRGPAWPEMARRRQSRSADRCGMTSESGSECSLPPF